MPGNLEDFLPDGNKGGAPTKYKKEFAHQAYKLCLLGFTDKDLAFYFGVDEQTITNWKKQKPGFFGSVMAGKQIADATIAESFFKRAKGYDYDEITYEKVDSKQNLEITSDGQIKAEDTYKKKIVTKHLPPDAGAAMNWLKNRQKDLWRDKQVIELDFDALTEPQLDAIIERLKKSGS
ncbi:MAG: Transposase [Ferruginibacter sp.]|uniref:hypothetical protein n=1 Tax=Ferruginibacter sp. TaxID=1940288 RepID=UPI00265B44C6|nr:hypothetical protein [Ferruginibacter sp.]MDB5280696.1 Transposase [Ferruginibacter sp.]